MRGEYQWRGRNGRSTPELPPRARRIQGDCKISHVAYGTTSACAENTAAWWRCCGWWWNYLRVRGEYDKPVAVYRDILELPPRARRIHLASRFNRHFRGTTSACAENTPIIPTIIEAIRNYLRVRGEYPRGGFCGLELEELPPRARRILDLAEPAHVPRGTTSACAENTVFIAFSRLAARNYLRVRGEYRHYFSNTTAR